MSTESDCIFCKIISGEIPCIRLFEDEHTLAFLDINPANEGHSLVIPKNHAINVYGISDEDIGRVAATAKRIAAAVEETLHPDGINLVQANGPGAGQSVFHFHIHVLPRKDGDELKMNWTPQSADMEALGTLAERIKKKVPSFPAPG